MTKEKMLKVESLGFEFIYPRITEMVQDGVDDYYRIEIFAKKKYRFGGNYMEIFTVAKRNTTRTNMCRGYIGDSKEEAKKDIEQLKEWGIIQ